MSSEFYIFAAESETASGHGADYNEWMCGIAGILGPGEVSERRRRVQRMTAALVHRGPDDDGSWDDESVSLGFRRLAVIDLATGGQPIRLEDDRAVIVLNGEIYNFRELRRELEPRHRFRSQGDVEVVLRLYADMGIACLERLNGMFALAIWDRAERTLFLARDRFGIKPLYWTEERGNLAFASELRALLAGGVASQWQLDPVQLRHYLAQGYLAPGGSPLSSVRSLPPATVMAVAADGGRSSHRYWRPPECARTGRRDQAEVEEQLSACLAEAAARQLVADVPVGVFLSGGLDSSTLTALVRRAEAGPVRTFSVGFEEDEVANELAGARQVARQLGTDHHELVMQPAQVARDAERIVAALDAPLADATAVPTWYMSQLARTTVTVALSGEGADELFGGYARQRYDVALDRFGAAGRALLPVLLRVAGRRVSPRLQRRLAMAPSLARQLHWSRVFTAAEVDELCVSPPATEEAMLEDHAELARRWQQWADHDPVNGRLETDRELFLPGDLLPKVDRMSMAHSLEVRVPYLDNEVADLVLPLPGALKQSLRHDKRLLRRVAARVLPRAAAERPKQGFDVPMATWLRGCLRPMLTDLLAPAVVERRGLLRPTVVTRLVEEHLAGNQDHSRRLWSLLVLEGWQRTIAAVAP